MRYEGSIFRPPSEAESLILQATVGCSWNHCTYCAMYREKSYRVRPIDEVVAEVRLAGRVYGTEVTRLFVADGDALAMEVGLQLPAAGGTPAARPRSDRRGRGPRPRRRRSAAAGVGEGTLTVARHGRAVGAVALVERQPVQ